MTPLADILTAERILSLTFHSLIFLAAGWVFLRLFRRSSAPLRSGVILMIMTVLLLLPLLSLPQAGPVFTRIHLPLPASMSPDPVPSVSSQVDFEGAAAPKISPEEGTSPGGFFFSPLLPVQIINGFGLAWGIGVLFCLLRILYGTVSMRKFRGTLIEIKDSGLTEPLRDAEKAFGKSLKTRIYLSDRVPTPVAAGLFNPAVVIPSFLYKKLSPSALRGILLHELSHIYHRDQITGILQRFVTALNWWNPLVYSLSDELSRTREEISDTHVLLENDSRDYAECLISLAETKSLIGRQPVFTAMASPHIPLRERVKNILSKERSMETRLKKSTVFLIVLITAALIGAASGNRITLSSITDREAPGGDRMIQESPVPEVSSPQDMTETAVTTQDEKMKEIIPAKLIKKVDPIYPKEARDAGITGVVIVEATTDEHGRVKEAKALRSVPELEKAALDAVKQWVYEPMIIDGKPHGITFTVSLRFNLDDKKEEASVKTFRSIEVKEGEQAAVNAVGDIRPPRLIKKVDPIYPKKAKEDKIEGVVILEATTDIYGKVKMTKILRSIPALDQAATDAIKQWVYEPFILDGKPRGVTFTVTCRFKLKDEKKDKADHTAGALSNVSKAAEKKTTGSVIADETYLEVPVRISGKVEGRVQGGVSGGVVRGVEGGVKGGVVGGRVDKVEVKVEGGVQGGVSGGVIGGIAAETEAEKPVRAVGEIKPPKIIKLVHPVYPPEAKDAGIEGVVIIEATTDIYGRVKRAKVLRSIPELDQAALDAVYQWVYEPLILDGKPREVVFTVTVRFKKE